MIKNTTKKNLQQYKDITFVNKGLKTDIPTEIFMIKVKDRTLLSQADIQYGLTPDKNGEYEEYDEKTGTPYIIPGRGYWSQSSWNSKRFLTKESAEKWLKGELSPLMWTDEQRNEFRSNLMIVKTKCEWIEA